MDEPTEDELAFTDSVALFFEHEGMPPIAGRVIGWLLISDPPEQSAAQLARTLQVSRSSISTATRMLTPSGLVQSVRKRGHRQEYFRISEDGWSRMLARRAARATAFREVAERGLGVLDEVGADPERRRRLAGVHELYAFLESELPAMWERWDRRGHAPDGGTA